MSPFAFLALRVREIRNALRYRSGREGRRLTLLVLLAAGWLFLIANAVGRPVYAVVRHLEAAGARDPALLAPARAAELGLLSVALGLQLLFGVFLDAGAAASLLAPELTRVLVAPVPPRRIVAAKIVENMPGAIAFVAPTTVAFTGAYLAARGHGWEMAWAVIVVVLAVGALSGALASMAGLGLARALPRRHVRVALEMGSALVAIIAYTALVPFHLGERFLAAFGETGGVAKAPSLVPATWLPTGFAARMLDAAADGRPAAAAAAGAALLASTALALGIAVRLGASLYATGWTLAETPAAARRRSRGRGHARVAASGVFAASVAKDLRLFRRNPQMLLTTVGLVFYFLLPLLIGRQHATRAPAFIRLAGCWIGAALVGLDVGARIVPLDRLAFWRVRAAPVPARRIAAAKHASAVLLAAPLVVVGTGAVGVAAHAGVRTIVGAIGGGLGVLWAACAAGVALGAAFGNFEWESRKHMLRMPGQWLQLFAIMPLVLLYIVVVVMSTLRAPPVRLIAALGALAVGLVVAASALWLRLAARRFDRIEWPGR